MTSPPTPAQRPSTPDRRLPSASCAPILVGVLTTVAALSPAPGRDDAPWTDLVDPNARSPVERRVDRYLRRSDANVARLRQRIASDRHDRPRAAGWFDRTFSVRDGAKTYDATFSVRIPKGFAADRNWPVLLICHGQRGSGRGFGLMIEQLFGPAIERYLVVAPTMPGPEHYNARRYQETSYLRPLDWARRNLPVDDDRIHLTGYSQGGHGTWHLATMYPHRFASALPLAGIPVFQGFPYTSTMYAENLLNLPVWHIWGELDKPDRPGALGNVHFSRRIDQRLRELDADRYTGTEIAGGGHGACFPKRRPLLSFLGAHRRVIDPNRLTHRFHQGYHKQAYYLHAVATTRRPLSMARGLRIPVKPRRSGRPPTQAELRAAQEQFIRDRMFSFSARLDRPANTLTIEADGVRSFRLEVIEGMFELSRPITIRFDGGTWTGRVRPSPRCLLTHYADTRDQTRLVLNELAIFPACRVRVAYPNR